MHSATKYIAGHSDVVIGALALNDENLHKKINPSFKMLQGQLQDQWTAFLL